MTRKSLPHSKTSLFSDLKTRLLYYPAKPLVNAFFYLICRRKIRREASHLPPGQFIIVANHISNFDIPLIGVTFPSRVSFVGKEQLFLSPLGPLFRALGSFAIRRGRVDREALRKADEVLGKGLILGIFPEGGRSRSHQLMRPRPGVALLAFRSNAYIVPVGISGTEKIARGRGKIPFGPFQRPLVEVHIGEPFKLSANGEGPSRADLASGTTLIMERIASLLPESYRGIYKAVVSGDREG